MTGVPAWAWPRGCPARTSRTSCSSTPSGPAPPWSGTTSSGPRLEGRSARASTASRSSPSRPGRAHSARTRTRTRTSLDRPGARPTGLPTSGTCPRPPGRPLSDDAARPSRDPPAGVWDALCWLARRQGYAVELEHGPPPDGTVFWAARRIRIPPGLSGEQAVWALAHQLGHVLLHHDPGYPAGTTTSGCAGVRKAEAELGRLDHLRPPRHHPRRRPALPGQLGRHRPARPARRRHPGRRAPHHHSSHPHHPPHQPHPARRPRPRPRPGHPARRQPRTRTRRHHPPHPRRRPCLLHRAARRQLGTRLPARPRHHRRRHPGLAHRVRPRRVDRPHQPPAQPRPP